MWKEILYVGAGSFVGGVLRYVIALMMRAKEDIPDSM